MNDNDDNNDNNSNHNDNNTNNDETNTLCRGELVLRPLPRAADHRAGARVAAKHTHTQCVCVCVCVCPEPSNDRHA